MTTDITTDPLRFAYWVPNVSGGLVTSTIEQRTDWSFDYNRTLARLAERAGFEYALSQVRYTASYGAEYQHESTSFSLALLMATERLKLIAAVHPGLWQPGVLAKWLATADHLSGGRVAVNVVSGWFADEFRQLGEPWLEHDERYRRSAEFMQALRAIWTEDPANLAGDFYRIRDFSLKPKPLSWPGRPHPEIFQGGNSTAARRNGGRYADWYFSNGKDFDGVREQLADLEAIAAEAGRTDGVGGPKFGLNGFVIVRDTESEARDTLREIVAKAHVEAVEGFGAAVKQAGQSTQDKKGMWADSSFEDLVQYNDGFRTQLIGTPEQVAERIVEYRKLGVDLILTAFLHFQEEVERFGRDVLPIVRELEIENGLDPAAVPDPAAGLSEVGPAITVAG
jgi:dimethylsulfone monooxygenase